ncbi:ORF6N domain-containing protein [Geminisphaera colitermitum]|uniref:ORF6N domain-containing protein n=1 Tax=Geminisphaera colitermitum TaxID=1148786 RepID=UPI000158D636|nr:ORF6N domain-containing protein [Geminisphaera colitermitum]
MSDAIIPLERIHSLILILRGQRVILDRDLALLYGVTTKRLNEQVKRNQRKFPEDFMFQLNGEEKDKVVANCDHLRNLRFSSVLPYAFTEHGAVQAANVLNSDAACEMSVQVVRAFVALRHMMVNHKALSAKLAELDARIGMHDDQIGEIVKTIRQLASPDGPRHRRKIGFHPGNR